MGGGQTSGSPRLKLKLFSRHRPSEVRLWAYLAKIALNRANFITSMSLNVGSRLRHYDVTALIGEGGMGQSAVRSGRAG